MSDEQKPATPRADIARVMAAVWDLVRSGPNFDGRARGVEIVVAAAIDAAVAKERERCALFGDATLAGELQALRNHVAHWERAGIDGPALARANAALQDYLAAYAIRQAPAE